MYVKKGARSVLGDRRQNLSRLRVEGARRQNLSRLRVEKLGCLISTCGGLGALGLFTRWLRGRLDPHPQMNGRRVKSGCCEHHPLCAF
jgi:hypothetical protein